MRDDLSKIHKLTDLAKHYDALIFDIWGVLHEGDILFDGITELFKELSKTKILRIISNAPRTRETIATSLKNSGLIFDKNKIFTSGETTRTILNESEKYFGIKTPKIYHIGKERNKEITENLNITEVTDYNDADFVLLTAYRDLDESEDELLDILKKIKAVNKQIICGNPDIHVIHNHKIRKCAGYYGKFYESLGGKVYYCGKPSKIIFEQCFGSIELKNPKTLMIGDTFHTDIRGAKLSEIDSAMVLTGNLGLEIAKHKGDKHLIAQKICMENEDKPNYLITME